MKLHFDSNQQYQWDAIHAVTDLFEGQPLNGSDFEFPISPVPLVRVCNANAMVVRL